MDAYIEFLKALVSRSDCGSERVHVDEQSMTVCLSACLSVCTSEANPRKTVEVIIIKLRMLTASGVRMRHVFNYID